MFLTPRKIFYYASSSGRIPLYEWMKKLDPVAKDCVYDRIEKIKIGYFGDYKNLGEGVFEIRIHLASGYRIYYGIDGREVVLLLCAGDKASQKNDIKKAKLFWEDYKNAKKA